MTALSFALLLLLTAADPAPTAAPPAAETTARAKLLFEDGLTAYEAGDYATAVQRFQDAHALSKAPVLLFNIGQAYRRSGDCAGALDAYLAYRRAAPEARNRELTDRYVDEESRCVELARPVPPRLLPPPAATTVTSPQPLLAVAAPAAPPVSGARRSRKVGLGLAALSVAGAVTGAIFAVDAARSADSVSAIFDGGGMWDQSGARLDEQGRRAKTIAIVSLSAAAVSAVAAWLLLRR